jgi:predicted TIM-barrel fold metal-dependent hydrolase
VPCACSAVTPPGTKLVSAERDQGERIARPAAGGMGLVDSHVHFFDRRAETRLAWAWLDGNITARFTAPIISGSFLPTDLQAEAEPCGGLRACVHVSSTTDGDPVAETEWLASLRGEHGYPNAAIASAPLESPELVRILDRQLRFDFVRGVRDLGHGARLGSQTYFGVVQELGRRGLIFEVACGPRRFAELEALAAACPETTIVLEHFGFPPSDADGTDRWRVGLGRLARCENVYLKLSGIMMHLDDWRVDRVSTLVGTALDAFGAGRCMFGSNFPIDRARMTLAPLVAGLTASLEDKARERVLCTVARTVYNVDQ